MKTKNLIKRNFPLVLSELLHSNYDSTSTKNEAYAEQLVKIHAEFVKRNKQLTLLLDNYIIQRTNRIKTNNFLKKFIFWFFVGMLGVLTVAVVLFIIFNITIKTIPELVSLITVSGTYLASLIGIFQIMSKYLFPVDEEKDAISMIKTVINNDVQVEQLISNNIGNTLVNNMENLKNIKELKDNNIISEKEFNELKENIIEKIKKEFS